MNETMKTTNCERAGELVAYFYGEAHPTEREGFKAHLASCSECRDELVAFAGVREAVGHWRAEILNAAPVLSFADMLAPAGVKVEPVAAAVSPAAARAAVPPRSALGALRDFFTLSPVWLRAGAVAATFALCALVALAVFNAEVRWDDGGLAFSSRLRSESKTASPTPPQVVATRDKVYSQAELDNLVAERDAALRELEDTRAQLDDSREANLFAAVGTLEPASASSADSTPKNSRRERRAPASPNTRQRRPRNERDEENMPRLYDLLNEAN
jgi:hypothetical protein